MSNAPNTVADQNWRKRGSSRNTDALIFVTMWGFSFRCVRYACMLCTLGVVHNCHHLCISTESTRGRAVRGQHTIFKMLINLWNIL